MKKKVAVIVGVLLLAVALFLVLKPSSFEKKADKTMQKLTSYKLEEIEFPAAKNLRTTQLHPHG